jgi:hypothetical protein
MLSQFDQLSVNVDGRYATDEELKFLQEYLSTVRVRLSAYRKIEAAEQQIIQQVLDKIMILDPTLLMSDSGDLQAKWQRDTVRVLRYAATALLLDDVEIFQDRFLAWFQTVMAAFRAERSCNATYVLMQDVVRSYLTSQEANLFLPILELTRVTLGKTV